MSSCLFAVKAQGSMCFGGDRDPPHLQRGVAHADLVGTKQVYILASLTFSFELKTKDSP